MDDIIKSINDEMIQEMLSNQYVEPLTIKIDNSKSAENLEKTRKSLISEKESKERLASGTYRPSASSSSSSTTSQTSNSYNSGSSSYRSYVSYMPKTETEEEKAKKFANQCAKDAIKKAGTTKRDWDIVSSINKSSQDKSKTPKEIAKEKRHRKWKKTTLRSVIAIGKTAIEILYLKGGKR